MSPSCHFNLIESAIVRCLGSVLAVAGDSVGQLLPEITVSLTKLIRASHAEAGLRAVALHSMQQALLQQKVVREEALLKDLWKAVKAGIVDKFWFTQMKATEVRHVVDQY